MKAAAAHEHVGEGARRKAAPTWTETRSPRSTLRAFPLRSRLDDTKRTPSRGEAGDGGERVRGSRVRRRRLQRIRHSWSPTLCVQGRRKRPALVMFPVRRDLAAIVCCAPIVISAGGHQHDELESLSRHRNGIAFFAVRSGLAAVSLSSPVTLPSSTKDRAST
jgi:hypothetical protein